MTNHCTYAQALLLKEIGFDMPVRDIYIDKSICVDWSSRNWNKQAEFITSAPTRSEVLQWAREKKGIHGWIEPFVNHFFNRWTYSIAMENEGWITINEGIYPTYPEAEDALIDKIILILTPSAE